MTCDEALNAITNLSSPRRFRFVVRIGDKLHEVAELVPEIKDGPAALVVVVAAPPAPAECDACHIAEERRGGRGWGQRHVGTPRGGEPVCPVCKNTGYKV